MERKPIRSSNLLSVGYDGSKKILEIEFKGHRVYQYKRVPSSVYKRLIKAWSAGHYHNTYIKGVYPFERLGTGGVKMLDFLDFYCIRTSKGIFHYKPGEHDIQIREENSLFHLELGDKGRKVELFSSAEFAACEELLAKIINHINPAAHKGPMISLGV